MKGLFIAILSVTSESINAFFPRYVHWPQQSNPFSRDSVKRVFKPFLSHRNRWMANVTGKVISFKYGNKKTQKSEGEERTHLKWKKSWQLLFSLGTKGLPGAVGSCTQLSFKTWTLRGVVIRPWGCVKDRSKSGFRSQKSGVVPFALPESLSISNGVGLNWAGVSV